MRRRPSALLMAMLVGALVAGATPAAAADGPIGSWALKGNLGNRVSSTLVMSRLGDTSWVSADVNGTTRKVLAFDAGEGLRVTGIPKSARRDHTIEVLLEFDDLDGYRRILSFGPNNRDDGLYFDDAVLDLYSAKEGPAEVTEANRWTTVRVTRAGATGRMRVYVDGLLVIRYLDSANEYTLRQGEVVFFQDDGNGEDSFGSTARIRIWRGAVAP